MKLYFIFFIFLSQYCVGQQWEAEVMVGASSYNGDLTQHAISLKNVGPAVNLNLKYNFDNFLILRGGIGWGQISADDKNNSRPDIKNRNLNFHSNILEGSICAEFN